ncbi:transporter [Brenneria izbisi]|uniref:Transporter n=1 Tax=Brenneria izbisi TaxID=2939450 RepID=A0AA41XUH5_9GAMM|nr:transporter [Brenneria izbisi]MCV9878538.1 transporter [Brenneria izbisi]MCV9881961.1 transporter [Brenneria izbisi]
MNKKNRSVIFAGLLLSGNACIPNASALEITPGDYEPLPAQTTMLLLYYQHAERTDFYLSGKKLSDNYRLNSDIGMLRVIHAIGLNDNISISPQVILPFGRMAASGEAQALGKTSGIGDLVLGAPVKIRLNTASNDILAFGPYLYLPTGSHDRNDALNMGENRWRFLLQGAWIHRVSDKWALDTAADVSWVTDNNEYGPNAQTQKQKPRYEYQAYMRYQLTPQLALGFGGGYIDGARSSIDGADQNDALRTTYARLTATYFITPTLQVQAQVGRDLHVSQGFEEDRRFNLRLATLF